MSSPDTLSPREPALKIVGVSKTFSGVKVLDNLTLDINAGEVHGLVGENGSGKSTVIKILAGYHKPDPGGRVLISGKTLAEGAPESSFRLGCRFVHQDLGLVDSQSILDNLRLNGGYPTRFGTIRSRQARAEAESDLALVGLDVNPATQVSELSPAMRTQVAVARALRNREEDSVRLLVMDEPTATLPESEVDSLISTLRAVAGTGVGVLYVSHRLDEVFRLTSRITVLRDGQTVAARETARLKRSELVKLMVGLELESNLQVPSYRRTVQVDPVLSVVGLEGGNIASVSFDVMPGDIVGIAGITGSGRDEVLGSIFGAKPLTRGTVSVGGTELRSSSPNLAMRMGVSYLPADRKVQGGVMDHSARENLTLSNLKPFWHAGWLNRKREVRETAEWFQRLDIRPREGTDQSFSAFSGGNQQKILFGKWLRIKPSVLLVDEPSQGVDVGARSELHRQLIAAANGGTAVIVSSSDADELVNVCQVVLVMRQGRIAASLEGSDITMTRLAEESLGIGEGA